MPSRKALALDTVNNDWDDTVAALSSSIQLDPVPGRGFLIVVRGTHVGQIYPVLAPETVIGRALGTDVQLKEDGVSRFHCKLRHAAGSITIEDLESRNGTYCNGERVVAGRALVEGDRLQIGTTSVLRFTYEERIEERTESDPSDRANDLSDTRDALTGMFSSRYFVERLHGEILLSLRHGIPLSLVLVHIDRYADISATRGIEFANEITTTVARHILDNLRKDDVVARLAAGEFGMISRSSSSGDTFMLAERLRKSNDRSMPVADGIERVSISLAVAALQELGIQNANDLQIAAGTALRSARAQGGNRVVLCTPDLMREPRNAIKV